MLLRSRIITVLLASLALIAQVPAQASDRKAAIAGALAGAVIGGVIFSQGRNDRAYSPPQHEHYSPPQAYYPPQRVYYERQPVYYQQAPVYYQQAPVYYVLERPRHKRWHGHKHRQHDDYGRRW